MLDQELIQGLRNPATKEKAFSELVGLYQERIYWHIRKIVIDHDDADDMTQEVFLKIWNNISSFREEAKIFTWMYRIATNECLSFLRSKRRKFFLPIHDVESELMNKLSHSSYIDPEKIDRTLHEALLSLPTQQRIIFNMRYYDELKFTDIAESLGKTVGAIKANYHHARKKVEKHIKKEDLSHED